MKEEMLSDLYVNLREHFDKLWIEREKNIDYRFEANTKTLDATAKELAHRLEVLNHAHEQSLEDRADFVKQQEYDQKMKDFDMWKFTVDMALTKIQTRSVVWMVAIGFFVTVIQIMIKFWK